MATDSVTARPPPRARPSRWSLRAYLVALVTIFVAAAAAGTWYGWVQARQQALASAAADAQFGARVAARTLASGVQALQTAAATAAAAPSIADAFRPASGCTLTFSVGATPDAGHLDVVARDGAVRCSSRPIGNADAAVYRGASWLAGALRAPVLAAPVPDPRTGLPAVVATAPVPGLGVVAAWASLSHLGRDLGADYGGPRGLEFLVTTGDTIVTRSLDGGQYIAKPVSGSRFNPAGPTARPDITGALRLYGGATVEGVGWQVFAGADRAQALGSVLRATQRVAAVLGLGLLVALAATLLIHGRITRPIARLSEAVHTARRVGEHHPVALAGPREVAALGEEFNTLVAAVDRELTERRRAEATAREHEGNYRQLFGVNPYPMFVLDAGTLAIVEANDAAVVHYGYRRDELLRLTLPDLGPPEEAATIRAGLAGDRHQPHLGPVRQLTRGGRAMEVTMTAQLLSFGGRQVRCVIIDDVTAKERLERQLRQSQRLESLGQLAGGVAHDFNNLLGVIAGYAGMVAGELAEAARTDPRWAEAHADIAQIAHAVDRATALTRQLLAFARVELAQPRVLDVNQVIQELEPLLRRTLGEDISLQIQLGRDLRPVCADPGQLEQVLVNLAVNARDAMPTGGTLVIDTGNLTVDDHYRTHHPGVRAGDSVSLRVSDTGAGMTRETIDRAFEPFFTTKPKGQGTGLGLATIYGIVTDNGGDVHIYSELDVGTTVTVVLPATDQPLSAAARPDAPAAGGRGETILLVEDQDDLRRITQRILERAHYRVVAAAGGAAALAVARQEPAIDLLLADVVMPEMPGHEVAERLHRDRPDLPVIYVSGYAEPILTSRKTLPADVTLLTKPVNEQTLLAAVRRALDAAVPAHRPR